MKKLIALVLAFVSLLVFALVSFGKNALEAYLSVQLMVNNNFGSSAYVVDTQVCQTILLVLTVVCFVIAIAETLRDKKK